MRVLRTASTVLGVVWFCVAPAQVVRQVTDLLATRTTDAAVDASGTVAFSISDADPFGMNPGHVPQVFKWDLGTGAGVQVTNLPRGDVASLALRGDGTVDLGDVACVENDSVDASTANVPDPDTPLPGQVHFYLHRGSPGPLAGPGSYGRSSGGGERTPTAGGCPG